MLRRRFIGAVAAGSLLAGCSGDGGAGEGGGGDNPQPTTTAPDTTPTGAGVESVVAVEMVDTAFDPLRVDVDPGSTVAWVNRDGFDHDVTATQFRDAAVDWSFSETLGAEEQVRHTFESPGVYDYTCTIHGEGTMCGTVLVGDATAEGSLPCASESGSGTGPY